jgi:hypothetical protein
MKEVKLLLPLSLPNALLMPLALALIFFQVKVYTASWIRKL